MEHLSMSMDMWDSKLLNYLRVSYSLKGIYLNYT